ncbi:MAG: RHS repeat-associated core domain-containing protein [Bacteroidales bacterium]|nr:RHS repeat-associated core domain-containing protein [Bacteroidales bacterium]
MHYSLNFAFSAKERDTETGLSYFGSRYYSSELSVWLSVDPMSDKYPSLSPYVYCADNPVKLVDPNGEDYEVAVDETNKTITIRANFYVLEKEKCMLEEGLKHWTDENGHFSYTVTDGDNSKTYDIKFDFNVVSCATIMDAEDKAKADNCGNSYLIQKGVYHEGKLPVRGGYDAGRIVIDSQYSSYDMFHASAHEPGHALGIGDGHGLMESGGISYNITESHIASSLKYAGFNCANEDMSFPTRPCQFSVKGTIPRGEGVVKRKSN